MLSDRISSDPRLWFPGIASELKRQFACESGSEEFCGSDYSTGRWISRDLSVQQMCLARIVSEHGDIAVEVLPDRVAAEFDGLPLASTMDDDSIKLLQAAFELLRSVESLGETVFTLVKNLHVLESDKGMDVSFSSPGVPFTIFVSVPHPDERYAVIRLVEGIVHEAMHLQLSLIENGCALVTGSEHTAYSPWKERDRPVQGVLHGIYVFAVILQALDELADRAPEFRAYSTKRRSEILDELGDMDPLEDGLTSNGVAFHRHLMSAVAGDA